MGLDSGKFPIANCQQWKNFNFSLNSLIVALQWSPLDVWLVKMWLLTLYKYFLVQANEQDSKNHVKIVFIIKSTSIKLEQPIKCDTGIFLINIFNSIFSSIFN